jgi:hypothetical protein
MGKSRTQKFDDMFFTKDMQDIKHFDKIKYAFHRIRNIMIRENPDFDKLSILVQWNYCHTIYLISMNGKRSIIKEISFFNKNIDSSIVDFDIEYGFEEPDYIEINNGNKEIIKIAKL